MGISDLGEKSDTGPSAGRSTIRFAEVPVRGSCFDGEILDLRRCYLSQADLQLRRSP